MTKNITQHEPCPVCGCEMDVANLPMQDKCWLACPGCSVTFGYNPWDNEGSYESIKNLWNDWDTGISEQRGKWLEEHPCDGCVI
jgi:hypothetical protein